MFRYEHPVDSDIPAIVEIWNQAFGPEWPLTERLLRQTMQSDPYYEAEGCWLARDEATAGSPVAGWILSKSMSHAGKEVGRFQKRGGIGAICVSLGYQRQGIGSQLLDRAESFLKRNGVPANTLYFPHHLLPGIPAECTAAVEFFRGRGYSGFKECVDLKRNLTDFAVPEKTLAALAANPGVEIRPAGSEEIEQVTSFVDREFPGGWSYSIKTHFARGGSPADVVVAVEDGEIIGFCLVATAESNWLIPSVYWYPLLGAHYGGLGPIGVAADHRKRGLGLALCAVAVQNLKSRGVQEMAIDWTTLIAFYEQLGFKVWKRYLQAERPL